MAIFFFGWLIILLAITYWPNMPDINADEKKFRADYLGHFGFYALLLIIFLLWQKYRGRNINSGLILQAALVGIALGVITEFTQQLAPGRTLNPIDMLMNCTGIAVGALAFALFQRRKQRGKNLRQIS
jgi:VanZ family protein